MLVEPTTVREAVIDAVGEVDADMLSDAVSESVVVAEPGVGS
jgi:hypothetical protein